jgi:glutamate---cysteine ligase / carboxylate-amine ligase
VDRTVPSTGVAPTRAPLVPAFRPGGDFSVGVEEELMLVDARGELLGADAAPLVASLQRTGPAAGGVTGEVYVDQVEINSPPCASAEDVHAHVRALRAAVLDRGARVAAVGVHPSAPLGGARLTPSPRYDAIVAEYAGLLRTPTAALQVHVGLPDAETAMLAYRGLRHQMPLLRALTVGSPYWHGVDSGLASTRAAILRSYPRTTVAPLLRSWEEYVERTELLVNAAEVPDHTYVWWDLRPRPELGTLEVRVMDAQPSLARVAGLTALVQGIARRAVEAPDPEDLADDVVAINDQRAARDGLDPRIVDVDGTMRPLREVAGRVLAQARAVLAPDGRAAPLDVVEEMLLEPSEPARQRRLHASGGMPAVLADLVARTADLDG